MQPSPVDSFIEGVAAVGEQAVILEVPEYPRLKLWRDRDRPAPLRFGVDEVHCPTLHPGWHQPLSLPPTAARSQTDGGNQFDVTMLHRAQYGKQRFELVMIQIGQFLVLQLEWLEGGQWFGYSISPY
jgi:hypothetical protein